MMTNAFSSPCGLPAPARIPASPLRAVLPVFALLLLGALSCSGDRGTGKSDESLPYRSLDKAFQPLRNDFEAESGHVRIVALFTPSCGHCIDAADAISTYLVTRIDSEDLDIFFVWASVAAPDVTPRMARLAERYADPRIRNYWDDSGRIARAFARSLDLDPGRSVWNIIYLYDRDDTWDPEGAMAQEPRDFNALTAGWGPGPPRHRMGEHEALRMPAFKVNSLAQLASELLEERGGP